MELRRLWLISRQGSDLALAEAQRCAHELALEGVEVVLAQAGPTAQDLPELLAIDPPPLPQLALVFGGDGTVLGAARHLAPWGVPLLSFNVGGHLGFLTHDRRLLRPQAGDGSAGLWQRLRQDRFAIDRRMMLEARLDGDGVHGALNDFYFRPCLEDVAPTCCLELAIDGEVVDQYRGDGLIIATPTGSTGYAMAAGGPILHPGIEAIVVIPICPMSLSSRAVVVPPGSRLTVRPLGEVGRRVRLWKDGAQARVLESGDHCVLQQSQHHTRFLQLEQSPSYYRTLTHKLHWAGSLMGPESSVASEAPTPLP